MRKGLMFTGLVLVVLLGSFSVAIAYPPNGKSDICHQTSSETNPEVPINVPTGGAGNASENGLEHGQGVALADDSGVPYGHRNDPIDCGDGPPPPPPPPPPGGHGGGRTTDASVNTPELAYTA